MMRVKWFGVRTLALITLAAMVAFLAGCSGQKPYQPPTATPSISTPVIGKDGVLRVGVNTANAPLAGKTTSSSKIVGIDVDVAAALADNLGLKLEVVDVGSDAAKALSDGSVDVVMGIDKSNTTTAFWTSDAYLPTGVALFSTPTNTAIPTNASKPKIAAQVSSKSAWAVTNEFDQGDITTTQDLNGAFSALDSGQVQYVAADAVIGTYAAHNAGSDATIIALMQKSGGYALGVSNANNDLKKAVGDALSTLQGDGTLATIETKWLGSALDLSQIPLTTGAKSSASAATTSTASVPITGIAQSN